MPFALKNGWGQELNLEYTFEKLFGFGSGNGYPAERVEPEQRNKKILDGVRAVTMRPLVDVLGEIDQDLVKGALAGEHFQEYFFANATDEAIIAKVKEILGPVIRPTGRTEPQQTTKQKGAATIHVSRRLF